MVVTRYFDPEDEAKYHVSNLRLLVSYLEAEHGGGPLGPVKIHPERQVLKLPDGERIRRVRFAEATAEQLRTAIAAAAKRSGKRDRARGRSELAAWMESLLSRAGLRRVRVRDRKKLLDLIGLASKHLPKLGRALGKAKPPRA